MRFCIWRNLMMDVDVVVVEKRALHLKFKTLDH
jgi:hypothetical protein